MYTERLGISIFPNNFNDYVCFLNFVEERLFNNF